MKTASQIYITERSNEMEPVLDELAEVNVHLRRLSQLSRSILVKLENHSQSSSPFELLELETKHQSIHANMARTVEDIHHIDLQLSDLLRKCRAGATA